MINDIFNMFQETLDQSRCIFVSFSSIHGVVRVEGIEHEQQISFASNAKTPQGNGSTNKYNAGSLCIAALGKELASCENRGTQRNSQLVPELGKGSDLENALERNPCIHQPFLENQ